MSRLGPLAFLLILASAAAASACCFFKCCYKSGSVAPFAPDGQSPVLAPLQTAAGTLQIIQVDSQTPDSTNNIPNDIDSTVDLQVVVQSSFDPSTSNPELTLTDLGPRTDKSKEKGKTKKYRPTRIVMKSVPLTSAASPTFPAPAPPTGRIWLAYYTIPSSDLTTGHNYSLVATAGSVTSPTVTFHTAR